MPSRFMARRRFMARCTRLGCAGFVLAAVVIGGGPVRSADEEGDRGVMRVETVLFGHAADTPASRSLTLFRDGIAWDFLELPAASDGDDQEPRMELVEIVLHDPARERVVVIDPKRNVKTQIERVRLERLGVSLAKWARSSDDRLIRWAGGPDFDSGLTEDDRLIELAGPRVKYAVTHAAAPAAAAAAYREFADSALLLRALTHPGGVPPFPRLALNRRIEEAGGIPTEVTLEIEPRLGPLGGRTERLKSVHKQLPRLLSSDLDRIETAESQAAAAESVDLAAFVAGDAVDSRAASTSR
jgi:hypothetical protein